MLSNGQAKGSRALALAAALFLLHPLRSETQNQPSEALPSRADIRGYVRTQADAYGIPQPIALATTDEESNCTVNKRGGSGEAGLFQIMPSHKNEKLTDASGNSFQLDFANAADPKQWKYNVKAGLALLKKDYDFAVTHALKDVPQATYAHYIAPGHWTEYCQVSQHCCRSEAQEIKDLGHFWAMKGTVQLLPTGEVLKREEGETTLYAYMHGHYVLNKKSQVPKQVMNWTYFDKLSVDWDDQLDRNDSDIPDGQFWPKNAKVKKLVYLSSRNTPSITIVVCYTVPEPPEDYPLETSKHIVLVALKGNMTDRGYVYHELWRTTVQEESSYGELTVQDVPNLGKVLVLYSASAGASAETEQLDLYGLQNVSSTRSKGR